MSKSNATGNQDDRRRAHAASTCPHCGAHVPADAIFCPTCSAIVLPRRPSIDIDTRTEGASNAKRAAATPSTRSRRARRRAWALAGVGLFFFLSSLAFFIAAGLLVASEGAGFWQTAEDAQAIQANVVRVIDGDTIEVEADGQIQRIDYLGIQAPGGNTILGGDAVLASEATAANRALVSNLTVTLEPDPERGQRLLGRQRRYVFVGGTLVNAALLRSGHARLRTGSETLTYYDQLIDAQQDAIAAQVGIWAEPEETR